MADGSRGGQGGVTRRQFLQAAATTSAGAVVFTGCQIPAREFMIQSRPQMAEDILTGYENYYATVCRACPAGCGTIIRVIDGQAKKVEGNPDHPLNLGKLCARGQATVQEQYHPDRLQGPMKRTGDRGSGSFLDISWDEALDTLRGRLEQIRRQGRQSEVALITNPLRAHRHFLVERFAAAYGLQWHALDLTGEAPLREAARRAFGSEILPEFDFQNARYVLSFGADFLGPWLSQVHHSVEYGRFRQGDYRAGQFRPKTSPQRGYLVQVEPRLTATGASADEWLWVKPGSEGLLALAIGQVMLAGGAADAEGARLVGGPRALDNYAPDRVWEQIGVPAERIRQIARAFGTQRPALAIGGGTVSTHTNSTESLTAIFALNLLAGNIGRAGGVLPNPGPAINGLTVNPRRDSLRDWQSLTERIRGGGIQAVLVKDANPVFDSPGALRFQEALANAPFVASFSSFRDETTLMADLILPSHLPLEEWGDDVPDPAPGFQIHTVQQPTVRPLYDTRSFWDVVLTLGEELGSPIREALPWPTFKDLLRERIRPLHTEGRGSVRETGFERFWVRMLQQGGWWDEGRTGESRQAAAVPDVTRLTSTFPAPQFDGGDRDYPFNLVLFPHNTLGSGENAHLPWLQAAPDPMTSATWQTWVEVNPQTAREMGLIEGDIVGIETPRGRIDLPVYVHPAASPSVLAVPLGQGHTSYGRWAERRGANPLDIVAPVTDQATGALAYGATRARLVKTGRRMSLPKYEGTAESVQIEEFQILKITRDA
ncbi:MAG: molybdopterin-dependent oxidoreductase [Chloroflexi bacterium]|nr:molybdopterin-dependent oxidoreductase [Chloroflexota bacterium]